MRRKHKVYYEIFPSGPQINSSRYWYSYKRKRWFIPQFDENGKGLPSNGGYTNIERRNRIKNAFWAAHRLKKLLNGEKVTIYQIFFKSGKDGLENILCDF